MEIVKVKTEKTIEVKIARVIRQGVTYRINESYGLDVRPGIITITSVGDKETMEDDTYDFDSWNQGREEDPVVDWVKYKYADGDKEEEILPLEQFVYIITRA